MEDNFKYQNYLQSKNVMIVYVFFDIIILLFSFLVISIL